MKTIIFIAFMFSTTFANAQFDICNKFIKDLIPAEEKSPSFSLIDKNLIVENKKDFTNFDDIKEPKTYDKFEIFSKKGQLESIMYKGEKSTIVIEFTTSGNECMPAKFVLAKTSEKEMIVQDFNSCLQVYRDKTKNDKSLKLEDYIFYAKEMEFAKRESASSMIKRIKDSTEYNIQIAKTSETFRKIFTSNELKELYKNGLMPNGDDNKTKATIAKINEMETLRGDVLKKILSETYDNFCDKFPEKIMEKFISDSSKITKRIYKRSKSSAQ